MKKTHGLIGAIFVDLLTCGLLSGCAHDRLKTTSNATSKPENGLVVINGVRVRLSFPFAVEKAIPLIAQLDLDTAIDPLLFPPHFADTKPIKTICLDPGHGGKDSGNRAGWHYEKNYTLPLAYEVRDQLRKAGFNVMMTRTTDKYVPLPDRPAMANKAGADLFVSLHFNATPDRRDEAEGTGDVLHHARRCEFQQRTVRRR